MNSNKRKSLWLTVGYSQVSLIMGLALVLATPLLALAQTTQPRVFLPMISQGNQSVVQTPTSDAGVEATPDVTPVEQTQVTADDDAISTDIVESDEVIPLPEPEEQPVVPEPNDALLPADDAVSAAGADAVQVYDWIGPWRITGSLGVGTDLPATKAHVVGNRIRLQNGTKIIDLRADGAEVDLQTWSNDLHIRSTGPGHDIHLNWFGNDGIVRMGAGGLSTELDVRGGIRTNGNYPVVIRRYQNLFDNQVVNTNIPYANWLCVPTGWSARWDFNENGTHNNHVWTYVVAGTWRVRVGFASHNDHERPDVDILCFRREIAAWSGASPELFEPN